MNSLPAYAHGILLAEAVVWFIPFVPAHQRIGPASIVNRRSLEDYFASAVLTGSRSFFSSCHNRPPQPIQPNLLPTTGRTSWEKLYLPVTAPGWSCC